MNEIISITRVPMILVRIDDLPGVALSETEAKTLHEKLEEVLQCGKTSENYQYCVLTYCTVHQERARSCDGFNKTVKYGGIDAMPRVRVCPACKKLVAVDLRYIPQEKPCH